MGFAEHLGHNLFSVTVMIDVYFQFSAMLSMIIVNKKLEKLAKQAIFFFYIKGDAKKMLQKLLTIRTFILKFSHFYSICHKIDTLCSLLSYWKYL